jgi:hypothetical protein
MHSVRGLASEQEEGLFAFLPSLVPRHELMEKLPTLEEVRKTAEGELEALRSHRERLEGLEWDCCGPTRR